MSGRTRVRCRVLVGAVAVALVAAGWTAAAIVAHGRRAVDEAGPPPKLGTAQVIRTDLATTRDYTGTLAYQPADVIRLRGSGIVTALPHVGAPVTRDHPLMAVDGGSVAILYGSAVLYRELGSRGTASQRLAMRAAEADELAAAAVLSDTRRARGGSGASRRAAVGQAEVALDRARVALKESRQRLIDAQRPMHGDDVRLVARNLHELGYLRDKTTSTWSDRLESAVRRWQRHLAVAETGRIDPQRVVAVGGPGRVSAVTGRVGDEMSSVVVSRSEAVRSARFVVATRLPAAIAVGRSVSMSLDGSTKVSGRVTRLLPAVNGATRVDVRVDDSTADAASVRVRLPVVVAERRNVLAVSVQALLALASGGYALELPDGGLRAVRTGMVQNELIEVSGDGVRPGLRVVSAT